MNIDKEKVKSELADAAKQTKNAYKKAKRHFPSIKNEITLKTTCFSKQREGRPSAETFLRICIECTLLKALMLLLLLTLLLCLICAHSKKKKRKQKGE